MRCWSQGRDVVLQYFEQCKMFLEGDGVAAGFEELDGDGAWVLPDPEFWAQSGVLIGVGRAV